MISYIWVIIIIFGLVLSIMTGNDNLLLESILNTGKDSYNLIINVGVMMVFFSGIMGIAKDGGLLKFVTKIMGFIIHPLFKKIDKKSDAFKYICGNISANMLGMGSAATPLGIKAMEELNKDNPNKKRASKEMITLLVINTSGLTIIPTSLLAIRFSYNAKINIKLIPYIILISLITTLLAIMVDYLFRRFIR